jgi:peptidoglycan/xylan/chitin deacetylase (PgdA/CDA1 family)
VPVSVFSRNPVRSIVRRIKVRLPRRAVILTYHRVGKSQVDPWGLFVSAEHFREHLEVLGRDACVMPLRDLVRSLNEGKLPHRAAAITFDDGYSDWLVNAKPALEDSGSPATLFLITGTASTKRVPWWDELETVLLRSDVLPTHLQLQIKGHLYSWQLGEAAYLQDSDGFHSSWRAADDPPTARHAAYFDLWKLLREFDQEERQPIMNAIRNWAGNADVHDGSHSLLSTEQITSLNGSNLFEVGAHTVTHPLLSTMSEARQREEIVNSKSQLEQILRQPVLSFAFPYGNYNPETIRLVRSAGFTCACGTKTGMVLPDTNSFELPRMQVPDCDGVTFAKRLSQWFSAS